MKSPVSGIFRPAVPAWDDLSPITAEIFGPERFKQHAHSLAETQKITSQPQSVLSVVDRLKDNAAALLGAYREICASVATGKTVTPGAEWLIDNYHLVEQQVRQTSADLPPGYYKQLPKLGMGPLAGHPRVFGLVWAYVAHTDSRFDSASLTDFVNEYQQVQPLSIGELWAVAISLRLILIENLRRIAQRMANSRRGREAADALADHVLASDDRDGVTAFPFGAMDEPAVTHAFAVQLIQRLRDQDGRAVQTLDWLSQKTLALGYSSEAAVAEEHLRQGAANITVRNIVTSMRLISDVNWDIWFDSVSLVDRLLRSSPNYVAMDFPSRTIYRTAIEELARGSAHEELDIAQRALDLASVSKDGSADDCGHYLIGPGREDFVAELGFRPPLRRRINKAIRAAGLYGYLGSLAAVAIICAIAGITLLIGPSVPVLLIAGLVLLALLPALEAASAIFNFTVTRMIDASVLPGYALRDGVPGHLRTLVVVPSMLSSRDGIEELIDRLEVHYLSNADGELYFALLTDWTDAETESTPADSALLDIALAGIAELNLRHATDRFLLMHRLRQWNPQQSTWMGWERKRGKLHELNRLLRGNTDTSFTVIGGTLPPDIKFVLTLDADTKLPRDAARRLVGKMAHPLNQPRFDRATGRVTQGYGVMQPRVTPSLPTGHFGSLFQRLYSTPRGIDPYAFAVSDVYQDLFSEGSFAGKGIYDIDAFEAALAARIPENTMLSHDLFEGVFARAALVTDIEVVEEYPERYATAAARQHRWTRGDWQLLPWMLAKTSPIPALGLWKMSDNIRRSLTPLATLASLFAGWTLLPAGLAALWTLFIILLGLVPALLPAIAGAIPRRQPLTIASRINSSLADFAHALAYCGATLLFLGHQAGLMADAIARTIYRLFFSRKNLLEWTTAAQAEANAASSVGGNYHLMLTSVAAGFFAIAVMFQRGGGIWMVIAPFAIAWLAAPAVAFWISGSPSPQDELASSPGDRRALRIVARRTWRFFESFVTVADNMLPPDNFQEEPKPLVAHRTSPTNIGLYLLSLVSAREFGWLGLGDALTKLEACLATVKRMETHRGHLYNWYDTQDLRPLEPKYISTVDSGNFAGHLIALANCCSEWILQPDDPLTRIEGIEDVLDIVGLDAAALPDDHRETRPLRKKLASQLTALQVAVRSARERPEYFAVRLIELAVLCAGIQATADIISTQLNSEAGRQLLHWTGALRQTVESHFIDCSDSPDTAAGKRQRIERLGAEARQMALGMEFGFLLDPERLLLSIGFRVAEEARDESCYDMLASEARLGSFFAIAKGDLRTRHWFRLGRTVTAVKGGAALVSWSGSMFEYLMPSLVMRAPNGGLLDQTTRLVVSRHIEYAKVLGIPWGISESAFNARDTEFTYQYSNFGVPGLGLKRGLSDNTVIAPYATGLAAMVAPGAAARNYERLARDGARGAYGYYEALDFTPARLRPGEAVAIVRAYFAHHQGMTIVAIFNAVKNGQMRDRFHAEPIIRGAELLLQERAPRNVPVTHARAEESSSRPEIGNLAAPTARVFDLRRGNSPATHLLSNGQYSVMMTAAGSGYSTWNGMAITRWREDAVCDDWGSFIYLREPRSGKIWSAGYMPVAAAPDRYAASFSEDKIEITRKDGNVTTALECVVSPEDNAEARRLTITNSGLVAKDIDVTFFAELVLAPAAADSAHSAFSKLFVETEFLPELETLLATRRRRSPDDPGIWAAQFMLVEGTTIGGLEYETDRARFFGIGNSSRLPLAVSSGEALSKTVGTVLDPVFALRRRFKIPPGRQVRCTLWTVVAETREAALDLVDRHRQEAAYGRALMLAWTQAQIQLRHLSIGAEDAHLYQTLASHLIYANAALRAPAKVLAQDMASQSALWPQGISGDRPILLVRIDEIEDIELVRQLLHAFEYWIAKRLNVDLVILNDRMSSYVQDLQTTIDTMVRKISAQRALRSGETGQVFALRADLMARETLRALPAVARIVLIARRGDLASQLSRLRESVNELVAPAVAPVVMLLRDHPAPAETQQLEFFNGFGGFDAGGREYVTLLSASKPAPAPWINVIANPAFGFQCAADGGGYTWFGNSRENQITAWSNDPVANRPGEVIYVRDEDSGLLMTPTLAPLRSSEGLHRARHGFGYSVFERDAHRLSMELLQLVPLSDCVKLSRLRLTNRSAVSRNLSVTFYTEWVLGTSRGASAPFVTTEIDTDSGAMLARNPWSTQTSGQVAFACLGEGQSAWTGDRREFLGPYGNLAAPRGMAAGAVLSNRTGGGMDPCCALQTVITLAPGTTRDVVVLLGAAANADEARALVARYRTMNPDDVLVGVNRFWSGTLGAVQVKTPDRSFDIMMNGWLLYQTIACRLWARAGFYQASGAYGFRDQLQDSLALLNTRPDFAREQILRAAARQFMQGDVQHWWLPSTGAGIRTRFADDPVWLAYGASAYTRATGDTGILDEVMPFIEGQSLRAGEHEAFFQPAIADETASLYEHCARGLDLSLPSGSHGLPLIGGGDWNDGMNRVGAKGQGESVWLGWFLLATLKAFAPIADRRGETARAAKWRDRIASLQLALEDAGWDGHWYRRGYFDDGTPLGSGQNEECRIDAIAQSWAVLSGSAAPDRARNAMDESWRQLVRPAQSIMALFTPPFDKTEQDPGYIKAYPPGIRENGGQYTHGVIWSIFAHAALNETERAHRLFAMLNPINHATTAAQAGVYRVEPYVIAADVYSVAPHAGRGGWTWYTGSAGWMYRAGLEAILGLSREGATLRIKPCISDEWSGFSISIQMGTARLDIEIIRDGADAIAQAGVEYITPGEFRITLNDEGADRRIVLSLPRTPPTH